MRESLLALEPARAVRGWAKPPMNLAAVALDNAIEPWDVVIATIPAIRAIPATIGQSGAIGAIGAIGRLSGIVGSDQRERLSLPNPASERSTERLT